MYRIQIFLAIVVAFMLQAGCKPAQNDINRTISFDTAWRFTRDSITGAEAPGYDDSKWRVLDLPHDWSIEDIPQQKDSVTVGPFSKASAGDMSTGHIVGGTGWYRKTFTIDATVTGKHITAYFEGAYMETDVWVNGNHVGEHKYGYTSFYFDITKYCKPSGEQNVIAVRVMNNGKNSRWYSGSGIYRHVQLIVTNPVHVDQWGVYITTPQVSAQTARVNVQTKILNESTAKAELKIHTRILDDAGTEVASTDIEKAIDKNATTTVSQSIEVKTPKLWSVDSPNLYHAEVSIYADGKLQDITTSQFGIRSISITAEKGFLLNGKPLELRGGCVHHDNGVLGAAAIDRAEERRVELLKANGFNAIRCSHNPPSEKFLEACDKLGMLVIDEAFDHWQQPKNPEDYHRFFDAWWEHDISAMVLRDRNHPSIILWSIGNEINERADSSGLAITKQLKSKLNELDNTRLVTEAVCEFWDHPGRPWSATAPAFALLDVGGYNYQWWQYENDHKQFPNRIMMRTESVPKEAVQNWDMVERHPYIIGDFVWTAMDYLGESGIGHTTCANEKGNQLMPWPWFNSYCGDIDLIGDKKPQSYYRDVVWRRSIIEMAVHTPLPEGCKETVSYWGWPDEIKSWTWPGNAGKIMQVNVYARAATVRLMLNGKIIGERKLDSLLTAKFELPYTPGELKAVAVDNGKETGSVILTTAGDAKRILLKADRQHIHADRNDLAYVTVEVVDAQNKVVPYANIPVQFTVSGDGDLAGIGNANPSDMASFKQPQRNTFRGKCLVVLRPRGNKGKIILTAKTGNLESASIAIGCE